MKFDMITRWVEVGKGSGIGLQNTYFVMPSQQLKLSSCRLLWGYRHQRADERPGNPPPRYL